MAQAIVLLCDVHLADHDQRAEAETISWRGLELDLCIDCRKSHSIADLDSLTDIHGRKPEVAQPSVRRRRRRVNATQVDGIEQPQRLLPSSEPEGFTCPECGIVKPTARGLKMHHTRMHS